MSELETRVQGEERVGPGPWEPAASEVYWTVVQSLEQRVGSLEASAASPLEDRMRRLEVRSLAARSDRSLRPRSPSCGRLGAL